MKSVNRKIEKNDMIIEEVSLEELLDNGYMPDSLIQEDIWITESDENRTIHARLNEILELMTERERRVFTLRFGLEDGEERSLEAVAEILGVTKERVRQIESMALRRINHRGHRRRRKLLDYLD